MDNISFKNYYKDSNQYCKIHERIPEWIETKRALLALPGLMYRTHFSTWDLSDQVIDHDAAYVHFDYPKTEFSIDKVTQQLNDYIEQAPYEEIIIMGISFWEIVFRHLSERLSEKAKAKIKHHICLNGVSTAKELSMQYKLMLSLANIKSSTLNKLMGIFWIANREMNGILSNNQVYNKVMKKRIKNSAWDKDKTNIKVQQKRHQKNAALWFTPWYIDRARDILNEKNNIDTYIPTDIIYSSNDEFFSNPEETASKIAENINAITQLHRIPDWGHIALVEFPEKYNPTIENILDEIWSK
jgi:pimeloyl-ACP methyl ester carboxylesterase